MREAPPRDGRVARPLPLVSLPLHTRPEATFRARLGELGGTPSEVLGEPDLMAILGPRLCADVAVAETCRYHAWEPLGCPVTTFAARTEDHFFVHSHRDALHDALAPHPDRATGRPA
ncbi:MAG TPA: hypothetical protein VMU89_01090 [Thermomicrobiaceae bacterium]|nr:hypothetical protein [Thermomicrobiaceae bacterium]